MSTLSCGCDPTANPPHKCEMHTNSTACEAGHLNRYDWCKACGKVRAAPLRKKREEASDDDDSQR